MTAEQLLQAFPSATTVANAGDVDAYKRSLGSFYTVGNPFLHTGFRQWMRGVPSDVTYLEPFAGSGQIVKLMNDAGYLRDWQLFDVDQQLTGVSHRDTIADFPSSYKVAITNPPYLSYHFAVRKRLKVDKAYFQGYPSLYLTAIHEALRNAKWVGMIIPESFATSGLFTERLQHLISLPEDMFDDTEMPTCLALWGPRTTTDFKVWRCSQYVGKASELLRVPTPTPCSSRISFNRIDGQVGLKAIDDTKGPSITFGDRDLCPDSKVKPSGRLLSRIRVHNAKRPGAVADAANELLSDWREQTADFGLTAFKGKRDDGMFRRRLDFASARALLSQAVCLTEKHNHANESADSQ